MHLPRSGGVVCCLSLCVVAASDCTAARRYPVVTGGRCVACGQVPPAIIQPFLSSLRRRVTPGEPAVSCVTSPSTMYQSETFVLARSLCPCRCPCLSLYISLPLSPRRHLDISFNALVSLANGFGKMSRLQYVRSPPKSGVSRATHDAC
jgi:hypothetical protein